MTELTVKKIIPILVMLASILGAVLTFLVTLPPSETITPIVVGIATILGIIAAAIRLLKEIEKEVATGVSNYKNGMDKGE